MFNKKYDEQVAALTNHFSAWNRGSIIPWSEIETRMGRSRNEEGGWTIINRFRKRLLRDREIVTLAEDAVGLRLLTHEEAAREIPAMRQKRAYRQVNRGLREMRAIDTGSLTERLRLVYAMQQQQMKQERLTIGRGRRIESTIGKKTEVNPIRQIG